MSRDDEIMQRLGKKDCNDVKVLILRTLIFIIPFLCTTRGYGDAFIDDDGHRWYYSLRETGGVNITIDPPLYGIIVKMNKERGGKHHRPHVHAASFDIETREVLAGELDKDDEDMVRVWMGIHREELFANWKLLDEGDTFFKIEPLR